LARRLPNLRFRTGTRKCEPQNDACISIKGILSTPSTDDQFMIGPRTGPSTSGCRWSRREESEGGHPLSPARLSFRCGTRSSRPSRPNGRRCTAVCLDRLSRVAFSASFSERRQRIEDTRQSPLRTAGTSLPANDCPLPSCPRHRRGASWGCSAFLGVRRPSLPG